MGLNRPVRSIEYEPQQVVEKLPDELLSEYRELAKEEYGALEKPVVALTNQTMEMALCQDDVQRAEEEVERAALIHSIIINIITEQTDYSHADIVEYLTQSSLSMYSDTDAEDIHKRATEIAEEIDRDYLWPHFKAQAYKLHGKTDTAVIRHIKEAMTMMTFGSTMSDIRQDIQKEKRVMMRLQDFLSENTDIDLEDNKAIYEVRTAFKDVEEIPPRPNETTLDEWTDDN